ncbi:hypothetical protein B9T38_11905 [Acinetobacter sp. ANC 4218]|uniref:hypothetical protein n=1 Tax=Acinetobacter sp. ANC 4218 TaxID=1977880 RepID=UPI000A33D710|nr:hypothetical protein [Acinetobacter sp. ANC 4218]OTG70560.1 hypothetical protein B9T38_11905 [Acinetobacter sp. ANC 4218]
MSYGIKRGGKVKGKGTGTSDDVKKNVPSGSYIMPADSTKQIGAENLEEMGESKEKDRTETVEGMGEPREVNLSNGEFQLTPDQVHQVGVQALDQMKNQTHTPVDQPQIQGGFGIHKKPELFFVNGGEIPGYLKRREQNQNPLMSQGIQNTLNNGFGKESPSLGSPPKPQDQTTVPQKSNANFGLGKVDLGFEMPKVNWGQMNPVNTFSSAFPTTNENKLASSEKPAPTALKPKPQATTPLPVSATQTSTAAKVATPAPQPSITPAPQPSIQDRMNSAMWGGEQNTQATQPASTNTNPYAIQQKGNSFSYTNPAAASQARSAGIPELQSSGFAGGIRRTNDPKGVANFMANTREMGPTQDMIDKAVAQRELNIGLQGYGGIARQPQAPQSTPEQDEAIRVALKAASTPYKDMNGELTNKQISNLFGFRKNEADRESSRYATDANNATSQANTAVNNTAALQREALGQEGQNYRAELGENGQNNRYGLGLQQDREKFNAEYGLKNREMNLTEAKEGFGIRKSQRIEKLNEMYDHAQTNEQRQSIQARHDRLVGADTTKKNPYMTVGGGQEWNEKAGSMVNRPQQLFNYETGQFIDAPSQQQSQQVPQAGQVINGFRFKGGDFNNQSSWEKV